MKEKEDDAEMQEEKEKEKHNEGRRVKARVDTEDNTDNETKLKTKINNKTCVTGNVHKQSHIFSKRNRLLSTLHTKGLGSHTLFC